MALIEAVVVGQVKWKGELRWVRSDGDVSNEEWKGGNWGHRDSHTEKGMELASGSNEVHLHGCTLEKG